MWRTILLQITAVVVLGAWAAVEVGLLAAHAADGFFGGRWRWTFLPTASAPLAQVVGLGLLTVAGLFGAAAVRRAGEGRKFSFPEMTPILRPALPLAFAWVWSLLMQLQTDGRWSVAATLLVHVAGRLSLGAMVWNALDLGSAVRSVMGGLGRRVPVVLAAMVVLPLILLRNVPVSPTGDEPSYLLYTATMLHDLDFRFSDKELASAQRLLGLPPSFTPHYWPFKDPPPPLHFVGISIVLMPVYVLGRALGDVVATCRAFVLLLYGVSIALTALLAVRTTRLRGASLVAAGLAAISYPLFPMSYQIYPEMVVTPLVLVCYLILLPALTEGKGLSAGRAAAVLAICCLFPWFHSKFGLLSVCLAAIVAVVSRPWTARHLLLGGAVVAAGGLLFFAFHLPVFGLMLVRQSRVEFSLRGMLGVLTNSDSGLLPYVPWVLLLPLGFRLLWKRSRGWGLPVALLFPGVALYLLSANTENWNSGGDAALRFFTPVITLWVPLLACVLAGVPRRALYMVALLSCVPVCAALVLLEDPWTAYPAMVQNSRRALDLVFGAFSWRELFPHFQYQNNGVEPPMLYAHGLTVVAVAVAIAAIVAGGRLRREWQLYATPVAAVCLLAAASQFFQSPNWVVTASRMFADEAGRIRQMDRLRPKALKALKKDIGALETTRPLVSLQLPIALRPVETHYPREVVNGTSLKLPADSQFSLLHSLRLPELPIGRYEVRLVGKIPNRMPAADTVVRVDVMEAAEAGPGGANRLLEQPRIFPPEADPVTGDLVKGIFLIRDRPQKLLLFLWRIGAFEMILDRIELDYLGPETES